MILHGILGWIVAIYGEVTALAIDPVNLLRRRRGSDLVLFEVLRSRVTALSIVFVRCVCLCVSDYCTLEQHYAVSSYQFALAPPSAWEVATL